MHDLLLNHRITILLKPGCNGPADRIITESVPQPGHVEAFRDIEKNLNLNYRVPYISRGKQNQSDMIQEHMKFGNTVFFNMMTKDNSMFLVYLPENMSVLDKDIVRGMVEQLSDVETILIYQLKGEDHEPIDLDTFLHPKVRSLDTSIQNYRNAQKKD